MTTSLNWFEGLILFSNATIIAGIVLIAEKVRRGPTRLKARFDRMPREAVTRAQQAGNPHLHPLPQFATALVAAILAQLDEVYRIRHQELWDRLRDPFVEGLIFRPYEPDQEFSAMGNLVVEGVSIQWFRFPGRHEYSDVAMTADQWCHWFERVQARLKAQAGKEI
jgi:hypothetical protein